MKLANFCLLYMQPQIRFPFFFFFNSKLTVDNLKDLSVICVSFLLHLPQWHGTTTLNILLCASIPLTYLFSQGWLNNEIWRVGYKFTILRATMQRLTEFSICPNSWRLSQIPGRNYNLSNFFFSLVEDWRGP